MLLKGLREEIKEGVGRGELYVIGHTIDTCHHRVACYSLKKNNSSQRLVDDI